MIQHDIEQLIKPCIETMGYELWGCEYLAQGRHALLRVYIDKASGIGIEDCQQVSHEISAILDVENPISSQFNLEISSPGIPRPLFYNTQYQRNIGQVVQIKLFKPMGGKRKLSGKILAANELSVTLEIENGQMEIPFSTIVKANLTVE